MYTSIIFILLLMLSAFFSGYETAILSLRISRIRELIHKKVKNARLVADFKENQHKTIITILIGNNIVNISASAIATKMTFDMASRYFLQEGIVIAIATGIMTFVLLIFGEITPKTLSSKKAEKVALYGAKMFKFFGIILKPLIWVFDNISTFIMKAFDVSADEGNIYTTGELKEFVEMSHERGSLKKSEKEMIHNILDFNDITAKEIMKPLKDVTAVDSELDIKQLMQVFVEYNFSRLPVYKDHIEEIMGVVYMKDVLQHIEHGDNHLKVSQMMRKIAFVPAFKKINTLFHYFKKKKEHIVVVVNEFGNTLGIVTMEDVLEEIVGEIQDEFDEEEEHNIKVIDSNTIIAPGTADIKEINNLLGLKIDTNQDMFQTIAGYITFNLGRIPKSGVVITEDNMIITIIEATHKVINKVKIERRNKKDDFAKEYIDSCENTFKDSAFKGRSK